MAKVGRKPNALRESYREKYELTQRQSQYLTIPFLEQLERCPTEEAKRILLGITEREENDEEQG